MINQLQPEGFWLASGEGPVKVILAEGETRQMAQRAFEGLWRAQAEWAINDLRMTITPWGKAAIRERPARASVM